MRKTGYIKPKIFQSTEGKRKAIETGILFIAGAYIVGYIVDQVSQKNKYHNLWWNECDAYQDMAHRCDELRIENRKLKGEIE